MLGNALIQLLPSRARTLAARTIFQQLIEKRAGIRASEAQVHLLGPSMQARALVVHDRHDKEIPFEDAVRIAAHWHQAKLIATEGLGHRGILRSEVVVRARAISYAFEGRLWEDRR